MSDLIQVSVIIPTFNNAHYLPQALSSVFDQDIQALEVIIVDDGSVDSTAQWVAAYQKIEPRVQYLYTDHIGPAAARNLAAQKAKGAYLAFLDADDVWLSGKLQRQLQFHLHNSGVALSFDNYRHINEADEDLGDCFHFWPRFEALMHEGATYHYLPNALSVIFAENVIGTSTVMMDRAVFLRLGGFDESLRSASDWEFWLRVARHYPLAYCAEVTMLYLMHQGSISRNGHKRLEAMQSIFERYCEVVEKMDSDAVTYAKARLLTAKAEAERQQGCPWAAWYAYWQAWRLVPNRAGFKILLRQTCDACYLKRGRAVL